jgi:hypothetical protein
MPDDNQAPATAPTYPWDDHDRIALNAYLAKNPKFLSALWQRLTKIDLKQGQEIAALSGAAHAGGEAILGEIVSMATRSEIVERSPFLGGE